MKTRIRPVLTASTTAVAVVAAATLIAACSRVGGSDPYWKPGVGTPIDLRAYAFADDFLVHWPTFPATSYDAAFGGIGGVNDFVRDQLKHIDSSVESGLYDGTEQWNETQVLDSGETQVVTVTRIMTSKAGVYLPMRDGGYAVLGFDARTHEIEAKALYDSQGVDLPLRDGNLAAFIVDRSLFFASGERGRRGFAALADWARRNGVALSGAPPRDGSFECRGTRSSDGAIELRCGDGLKPAPVACASTPRPTLHDICGDDG
jgi:hypothetical protein